MNDKPYDLEERTYAFAFETRLFLRDGKWDSVSWSDLRQVLRSSGSVAANYVESMEAFSPDDYLYRLKVCKKEARESSLWLRLICDCNELSKTRRNSLQELISEAGELVKIFASIIRKKTPPTEPLP